MNLIQFNQEKHTKNEKFGPENNLFQKKTEAELIEEIEWLDAENSGSPDKDIQEMHKANMTRLKAFEEYKEEMISE